MNTVSKGDAFENRVYKVLKSLLENEELPLNRQRTRVLQKQKYYSPIQQGGIIFDISIESYMPNAKEYSSLWLIECKDYKSPIEVDKIRNFKKQIEEVGGHKGLFFATSRFQSGAIASAASYGIGLVVMDAEDNISWKTRRISSSGKPYYHIKNLNDIIGEDENNSIDAFVGIFNNEVFGNLIELLSYCGFGVSVPKVTAKYLTEDQIQIKATQSVFRNQKVENYHLSSKELRDIINNSYNIKIENYSPVDKYELGRLDISKRTIYISTSLEIDSPRWRFTLAHEFGHYILHEKLLLESNVQVTSDGDHYADLYLSVANRTSDKNSKRIEIQANLFASYLLMPDIPMVVALIKIQKEIGINKNYLCYDDQPENIRMLNQVLMRIGNQFGVSKETVKYRLCKLNMIRDLSHTKRLSSVLRGYS